jgi:NarL family two-component system response regulator LiaR
MDGPTSIGHIRRKFPEINIVALTSFDDDLTAQLALEAGAIGYLFKDVEEDELISAIRFASQGRGVVAPEAMQALVARSLGENEGYSVGLTPREQETLHLVARGMTNPEIADKMMVSVSTVNFHVHNVLEKLGAKTRTEAVVVAAREGLIEV